MEYLGFFILLVMVLPSRCLTCWKCIGEWCSELDINDYRISKISCPQNSSCMKVYYKMHDNSSSLIESVTRGCSLGKCEDTSDKQYNYCLSQRRIYGIDGCALKSCCNNKDLCNSATSAFYTTVLNIYLLVILGTVVL
ncbi:hypothetical protein LOTGIDRAFT_236187 [Lottia gigantea]|uniref:UPAR/Ly6 domain-containing protein n=1 Tax=Lottia gigantea TaxID=225164 RepID=V3ZQA1_LOTGI|nr:hypothetical protein LOTGIDRAFT_236187 [Lottia gigantea]ESO84685.1 hypothetical protein LOTGIDRAFT_236187 [Lottia gigantea]